ISQPRRAVSFLVVVVLFYAIIAIHDIPYKIAGARHHPHQDAIHAAGSPRVPVGDRGVRKALGCARKRRLQARILICTGLPIRRTPGCLWAKGGAAFRTASAEVKREKQLFSPRPGALKRKRRLHSANAWSNAS